MFVFNLLYLGLASNALALFNCKSDGSGDYYVVSKPDIQCFAETHTQLMLLSIVPLLIYVIGWPLLLMIALRNAMREHLFHDPAFSSIFGFVYAKFELEWFFWYFMTVFHKLSIVLIKIFLFDNFVQAPVALVLTFIMMSCQSFARPYASDSLDRLQSLVYGSQFLYLFIGVLLSTERGGADLANTLETMFFVVFAIMGVFIVTHIYSNLVAWRGKYRLRAFNTEHELKMNPKE